MQNLFHTFLKTWWFYLGIAFLVGLRFLHLGPWIDDPHTWRQVDTAQYIWDFYQNGIDLFHPSVCWMGSHKHVILEFPLYEGLVAVFYKLFGPDLIWARLVSLAFFLGGVRYFFLSLKLVVDQRFAQWASLIYLALPLGIFYSRAVHVDFSAVFFAHAMLFYFLKGIQNSNSISVLAGGILGGIGFCIKAPYLFYFAIPLLAYLVHHRKLIFFARNILLFLLPVFIFIPWQLHVSAVNGSAPDWDFIPGYRRFDQMWDWYFGTWEMRKVPDLWWQLYGRIRWEVMGNLGWFPFFGAILLFPKRFHANFLRWWFLGTVIYLLIFFNLNLIHDYYQIPFLAPVAFVLAMLARGVEELLGDRLRPLLSIPVILAFGFFSFNTIRMTEQVNLDEAENYYFKDYFQVKEFPIVSGNEIRAHTSEKDLVVVSYGGLDCRAPHILYRARRFGWSIPHGLMTPSILDRLRKEGASQYAVIAIHPNSEKMEPMLKLFPSDTFPIPDSQWQLLLYDLKEY